MAYGDELIGEIRSSFCKYICLLIHVILILSIATYHVQDFNISYVTNNGDIIITCIFAISSNATGCRVDFTSSSDYEQVVDVYKVDDSTVSSITTTVPDGTYDVTVYDVVGDSTVAAITTTTTITNVPVPTSTLYIDTPGKA